MTSGSDHPRHHPGSFYFHEYVEKIYRYTWGGYHPTYLGDIFHDRYKVIHKLGYGTYSVVWLARDLKENRNVALKIVMAATSEASKEAQILRAVNAGDKNHPGYSFISHLLDDFWFDGPNGHHHCIVLRATGCPVGGYEDDDDPYDIDLARSISTQALLGLSYIHSCGVVHGDLHTGNMMFQHPKLEHWTEAEVLEHLGEPERLPTERVDGQPPGPETPDYTVSTGMLSVGDLSVEDTTIIISDFGQSFFAGEERDSLQTPIPFVPPENFFKDHLGPAADVWTVGCSIFEILMGRCLFEVFFPFPNEVIHEMIVTLGHPPRRYWDSWEDKHQFYAEDGSSIHEYVWPLSERLQRREKEIGEDEQKSLEQLYRGRRSEQGEDLSGGMLEYEPSKRMTVDEALRSDWVTRWAWPDFKRRVASQRELPLRSEGSSPQTVTTSYATYSEEFPPQTAPSSYLASSGEPSPQTVSTSCTVRGGEVTTDASSYTTEQINDDNKVTGSGGLVPESVGSQNLPDANDASRSDAARKKSPTASIASSVKDCDGSGGNEEVNDAAPSDTAHNGSSTVSTAGGIKSCDRSGGDCGAGGLSPNGVESQNPLEANVTSPSDTASKESPTPSFAGDIKSDNGNGGGHDGGEGS